MENERLTVYLAEAFLCVSTEKLNTLANNVEKLKSVNTEPIHTFVSIVVGVEFANMAEDVRHAETAT
jgi:hypothetical protein